MAWKRTHTCGELSIDDEGEEVVLNGWVDTRRDLGGVIFIDLRDRYGITQIVFRLEDQDLHTKAEKLRREYVIGVKGEVEARSDENINPDLLTGEIDVNVDDLIVYSEAETPPFEIDDDIETGEDVRMKYRYLDLRRRTLTNNLMLRSKAYQSIRNYFYDLDFAEIETPVLMRSTPEGARDYLVPSRVNPGKFFALPQSPQTYKQTLMASGFDRYFQIVKCFRDEDLRADRQPEFTQIDVELSFIDEEDIYELTEGLMKELFESVSDRNVETPFKRMPYHEAIATYGTDKPDTRFGLEFTDFSDLVEDSEFRIFSNTVQEGGAVIGFNLPGKGDMGRGELDRLTERVQEQTGAGGLIYTKVNEDEIKCSVGKFLTEETIDAMIERAGAEYGDLILILAGPSPTVYEQLGTLRLMMGHDYDLIDQSEDHFLWITDFPLLEWDEETGRYVSLHHPFTAPRKEDQDKLDDAPEEVISRAYDLVLNGKEIGGGSIRIHNEELQERMFDVLGLNADEAREKFGFLMDAFKYGAPPHGGIALGLDRIIMLLAEAQSLRDVIAFPKNKSAQSPMDDSPSYVDQDQLDELHIQLKPQIRKQIEEEQQSEVTSNNE